MVIGGYEIIMTRGGNIDLGLRPRSILLLTSGHYNFISTSTKVHICIICGCISDPVVMQIIYLTFNLRIMLGMGSISAVGKNTSFCNSCLQPWNNLANTMLNQRAILIYHLTWALKLTCRDIFMIYHHHIC